MFENVLLIDIGALTDSPDGALGFKLQLPDGRIITVTGLNVQECRRGAELLGEAVVLELRAQ